MNGSGLHDPLQGVPFVLGRDERQGRIGAHTARIGTFIAVERPFVILRQHHRQHLAPRHETHERKFGSGQKILHDHTSLAELVVQQHVAQRGIGLLHRPGDNDTLSRSQTIVFQDGGQRARTNVLRSLPVIVERPVTGRRNTVPPHQIFCKLLARLDAGRRLRRAENTKSLLTEAIDDTGHERRFGSYHREVDLFFTSKGKQSLDIGILDRHTLGLTSDTRIAGSAIYLRNLRRTRQRIDDGMFAATAAYD